MAVVTFQNMAMCYQRQGMLEECAACLYSWLKHIQHVSPDNTIAERMNILRNEWKLRMQLCAILSQIHKHKEALIQAQKSVKLVHHLFKDLNDLWIYYAKRQEIERQLLLELKEKLASNLIDLDSTSFNELNEESLTLMEKTSTKLLPIIEEVIKRMIKENQPYKFNDVIEINEKPDMRNILGFLNQNEWVYNLNIGNIMQISSISHTDLMSVPRTEYELSREAFLEKITILWVAYFWTSTELRFIIQLREEENIDISRKEIESEYWHAKSLEIACVFLPSEWPLVNHILLSYQKHHAPTQYTIPEDSEYNDNLMIIKAMDGMQSSKFHPIVRVTPKPDPVLSPYPLSPLSKITDSLLGRLEENELKTIVTQSYKHTGQNSVVNLKDKNMEMQKESVKSTVRNKEEEEKARKSSQGFEDAYDDSAILEDKIKKMQNNSKKNYTEDNKAVEDSPENWNRPISNNNTEHLNPSIDQISTRDKKKNVDASTNTVIVSNDIELMQEKAETIIRKADSKNIATNTSERITPRLKEESTEIK